MTIQITRGVLGNNLPYIYFRGKTSDNTSSARIKNNIDSITVGYNEEDSNYIDIIDDDMTLVNDNVTYDLYKIHYSEWLDEDGNVFGDADEVIGYLLTLISSSITDITAENSLAQPRTSNQNSISVLVNTAFTYDSSHLNGIGYYWDESSFPTGVEVSRYDQRKIGGTITDIGSYQINLEVSNRNGVLQVPITIQVL